MSDLFNPFSSSFLHFFNSFYVKSSSSSSAETHQQASFNGFSLGAVSTVLVASHPVPPLGRVRRVAWQPNDALHVQPVLGPRQLIAQLVSK